MAKTKNDTLQGTLALLVLQSLEREPMHGWGITLHIERISNNVLRVEEGSSLRPPPHGTGRLDQVRVGPTARTIAAPAHLPDHRPGPSKTNALERENWRYIAFTDAVGIVLGYGEAKA